MLYRINGEEAFQIGAPNMTISPSSQGYELQISADGYNFTTLFSVDANITRMVTGVANGSYYRLLGNEDEIIINAMVQWDGETTTPIEDSISVVAKSANVTVKPSEGYDGFKEATVDYSSLLDAYYETGKLDVDANAVGVTMVENETKTATISDGYKGYFKYITVNVPDDEIVSLTLEEYNALTEKKPHTYYFIGVEGNWYAVCYGETLIYGTLAEPLSNFLQFTAVDGDAVIKLTGATVEENSYAYSLDGVNFTDWALDAEASIPNGSTLYVKGTCPNGTNPTINTSAGAQKFNSVSGNVNVSGKLYRLLGEAKQDITDLTGISFSFVFTTLNVVDASQLQLPASVVGRHSYARMFLNCTSLVNAPELPATTLAEYCYAFMFVNCTSLVNAPELPATTLADGCYSNMFKKCSAMTVAPILPALTVPTEAYVYMYARCNFYLKVTAYVIYDESFEENSDGWVDGIRYGSFVGNNANTDEGKEKLYAIVDNQHISIHWGVEWVDVS